MRRIVAGKPDKSKLYTTTVLPDDAKKLMPPKNKVTGSPFSLVRKVMSLPLNTSSMREEGSYFLLSFWSSK